MLFIDRSDGRRVRDLPTYNSVMPYIMRRRNESAVYFSKDIEVENAVRYVHRKNAELGESRYNLFGLILVAALRTFAEKPKLNRFVSGRAVYQRRELSFSFIVKKRLTEDAAEATAKIYFEPTDTLATATERINAAIELARSDRPGPEVEEIAFANRIPFGKALVTGVFKFLDRLNLAPPSMIRSDPFYTSAYFANLGSIGLDTPYHHLYEWGTASHFVVLGRMFQKEVPRAGSGSRRHFITMRVTVDERIADGIYFSHAAALFQRLVLHPELLEEPPALPA